VQHCAHALLHAVLLRLVSVENAHAEAHAALEYLQILLSHSRGAAVRHHRGLSRPHDEPALRQKPPLLRDALQDCPQGAPFVVGVHGAARHLHAVALLEVRLHGRDARRAGAPRAQHLPPHVVVHLAVVILDVVVPQGQQVAHDGVVPDAQPFAVGLHALAHPVATRRRGRPRPRADVLVVHLGLVVAVLEVHVEHPVAAVLRDLGRDPSADLAVVGEHPVAHRELVGPGGVRLREFGAEGLAQHVFRHVQVALADLVHHVVQPVLVVGLHAGRVEAAVAAVVHLAGLARLELRVRLGQHGGRAPRSFGRPSAKEGAAAGRVARVLWKHVRGRGPNHVVLHLQLVPARGEVHIVGAAVVPHVHLVDLAGVPGALGVKVHLHLVLLLVPPAAHHRILQAEPFQPVERDGGAVGEAIRLGGAQVELGDGGESDVVV